MAITLNGTTGISSPGGDTSTSLATTNLSYTGTLTGGTGVIAIGTNQIYKDASGNVGIGTASPIYKLDISGTNPRIRLNETTGYVLTSYVNSAGTLDIGRDSSAGAVSGVAYAGFFDLAGAYPYVWRSNSTERMRLNTSGNLGLGVTVPSYKMSIANTDGPFISFAHPNWLNSPYAAIGGLVNDGGGNTTGWLRFFCRSQIADASLTERYRINNDGSCAWYQGVTGYTQAMTLDASGNLLVGTTSAPSSVFQVTAYGASNGGVVLQNAINWSGIGQNSNDVYLDVGRGGTAGSVVFRRGSVLTESASISSSGVFKINNLAGTGSRAVNADASGNLSAASDSSLKQEDKAAPIPGLKEILKITPRAYKWLADIENRGDEAVTEIGFFADEVAPIIPSAAPKCADGLYGFYDRSVTAALVKAIQELTTRLEALEAQ